MRQVAIVAPDKVGAGLTAIVEVTLDNQAEERLQEFEELVATAPQLLQCYRVSPGPDFVLVVQVADMAAYHAPAHQAGRVGTCAHAEHKACGERIRRGQKSDHPTFLPRRPSLPRTRESIFRGFTSLLL